MFQNSKDAMDCARCAGECEVVDNVKSIEKATFTKCHVKTDNVIRALQVVIPCQLHHLLRNVVFCSKVVIVTFMRSIIIGGGTGGPQGPRPPLSNFEFCLNKFK